MDHLATSSPEALYALLVSLLLMCPQTIEILPGDASIWTHTDPLVESEAFSPFVFVEDNLGIPQKILYKVYMYAVQVFKSVRRCTPLTTVVQPDDSHEASRMRALADSSSILILTNPSHQTALNVRKHLVQMHIIDSQDELRFTTSLLSSQHCAKHAELWFHRRWLLCAPRNLDAVPSVNPDLRPHLCPRFWSRNTFQQELRLISRACELYPRNYFAWAHRIVCVRSLLSDYLGGTDAIGFVAVFRQEIVEDKGWIDRHITDYSAIHSILTLSQSALDSNDPSLVKVVLEEDLLNHAITLVQEYPIHEALWIYVQMVLSVLDLWGARQTEHFINNFVQPLAQSQPFTPGTREDLSKASKSARMFLKSK